MRIHRTLLKIHSPSHSRCKRLPKIELPKKNDGPEKTELSKKNKLLNKKELAKESELEKQHMHKNTTSPCK